MERERSDEVDDHQATGRLTRRAVLGWGVGGVAAAGLGAVTGPLARAAAAGLPRQGPVPVPRTPGGLPAFVDPLPIPPTLPTKWITSIDAAPASRSGHRFHSSLPASTKTWGYGGLPYLGPSLVATAGTPFNLLVNNKLGAHPFAASLSSTAICMIGVKQQDATKPRLSTHLHGAVTEPSSDGHPEDTILPGQTKEHYFDDFEEAKLLWYHDHALGITRLNVAAGLAGAVIVRDDHDTGTWLNPLGLPFGSWEVPLIIQDKMLDLHTGDQIYPPSPRILEYFGDQPVVNGVVAPSLNVDRGVYRFRLLNASNARYHRLSFTNPVAGQPAPTWYVIGNDHGLLDAPAPVQRLLIGPGERYDVLVDFGRLPAGTRIRLANDAPTPFPDGGTDTTPAGTSTLITELMQFVVGSRQGFSNIPKRLRGGPGKPSPLPPVPAKGVLRTVNLQEVDDPNVSGGDPIVVLNNMLWETPTPDGMQQGTTEIWSIVNTTVDAHPIHIHLSMFRVIDRRPFDVDGYLAQPKPALGTRWNPSATKFLTGTARAASAEESGWKDTVVAYPGEVTRIAVKVPSKRDLGFDPEATFTNKAGKTLQGYVWHCHILEHEDCDMMVPLRITKAPAAGL